MFYCDHTTSAAMSPSNLKQRPTPNDLFAFATFQGETLNKNPDKLYIFWKFNKWRLPYRIYWKKIPWKYSDRFAKLHGLQYSVSVQSEVIKRKKQTWCRVLDTFISTTFPGSLILPPPGGGKMRDPGNEVASIWKTVSANIDILPGLYFTPG